MPAPHGASLDAAAPTAPKRGRPRDARCDEAILRATLEILTAGGAANMSIDAVAAKAGVGKATIYRRWSSKEALVLEALGCDAHVMDIPDTGTLRGDLEAYFDTLLDKIATGTNSDVLPHLIEAACYDPEVRSSLDAYIAARQTPLRTALQRAQQRGEINATTDTGVLLDLLVGPVMYRKLLTGGRIDRDFVRTLLDLVLERVPG